MSKKIYLLTIILIIILLLTSGCTRTPLEHSPVTTIRDLDMLFDEEAVGKLREFPGTELYSRRTLALAGEKLEGVKATNMNGVTVELLEDNPKNKVVEVVSVWCPHCVEQMKTFSEMEGLPEDPPLILFKTGTPEQIEDLFEQHSIKLDRNFVFAQQPSITRALDELHVTTFPTTLFFDEENRLRFAHTGKAKEKTFEELSEFAYSYKLFEHFNEHISKEQRLRTIEDVKNELPETTRARILELCTTKVEEDQLYQNLFQDISFTQPLVDINRKVLENSAKGDFVWAIVREDDFMQQNIKAYNDAQLLIKGPRKVFGSSPVRYGIIIVPNNGMNIKDKMEALEWSPEGYVFNINYDIPEEFSRLQVIELPSVFFVRSGVVLGGCTGELNANKIAESYEFYMNEADFGK